MSKRKADGGPKMAWAAACYTNSEHDDVESSIEDCDQHSVTLQNVVANKNGETLNDDKKNPCSPLVENELESWQDITDSGCFRNVYTFTQKKSNVNESGNQQVLLFTENMENGSSVPIQIPNVNQKQVTNFNGSTASRQIGKGVGSISNSKEDELCLTHSNVSLEKINSALYDANTVQQQLSCTSQEGPPGDLEGEKKRWLVVGICLHATISPLLRKYIDPIISNLYNSLVSGNSIHTQGYHTYLKKYPATNRFYLNYESINNNRILNKNYRSYDYKVTSHVDLSKLFLQSYMAHYSGIDESCESSSLLGMVINISSFPASVQTDAEKIRSDIRNPWAHCDFREWTTGKYTDSFNLMGQLVKDIRLSNREENWILGELNTWATNGQHFLSGTTLGLEIVGDIHQQTHVLSRYVQTLCFETDGQFIRVQKELSHLVNSLQEHEERLKSLESKTNEHDETLSNLKKEIKKQVEDHIPPHIRGSNSKSFEVQCKDFEDFIKENWIFLKENSDAHTWKHKFLEQKLLDERDIEDFEKTIKRAELAEWLLIKSLQKVKTVEDITLMQSVVCLNDVMNPYRIGKTKYAFQQESTVNLEKIKETLYKNRDRIEDILSREDAITIKDQMVQDGLITLTENEKLLKQERRYLNKKSSLISQVMDVIINKLPDGSYQWFTESLEDISSTTRGQIINILKNKSMTDSLQSGIRKIGIGRVYEFKEHLQGNWRYLKNTFDFSMVQPFEKAGLAREDEFKSFKCQKRSKLADVILTRTIQKIENDKDIVNFENIIGQAVCRKLTQIRKDKNQIKDWTRLSFNRNLMVKLLRTDDIENVKDSFVQEFIINIEENDEIISEQGFFERQNITFSKYFVDKFIIPKSLSGSYRCLLEYLEMSVRNGCTRLRELLLRLKRDEIEKPDTYITEPRVLLSVLPTDCKSTDRCKSTKYEDLDVKVKFTTDNEATKKVYQEVILKAKAKNGLIGEELGACIDNAYFGSIVIHMVALRKEMSQIVIDKMRNGQFSAVVKLLFNDLKIKHYLPKGKHELEVTCSIADKKENFRYIHTSNPIAHNMSFLEEEMDTIYVLKELEKHGVQMGIDVYDCDREFRAHHIMTKALVEKPIAISLHKVLLEGEMVNVRNRHLQYEMVYRSDASQLQTHIFKHFYQITREVYLEDIRLIFTERNIIQDDIFEAAEKSGEQQEIAMANILTEIIKKGTDAMLTLVDALYVIQLDKLADKLMKIELLDDDDRIKTKTKCDPVYINNEMHVESSHSNLLAIGKYELTVRRSQRTNKKCSAALKRRTAEACNPKRIVQSWNQKQNRTCVYMMQRKI